MSNNAKTKATPSSGWTNILPPNYDTAYTEQYIVYLAPNPLDSDPTLRGGTEMKMPASMLGGYAITGKHGEDANGVARKWIWRKWDEHVRMYEEYKPLADGSAEELAQRALDLAFKLEELEAKYTAAVKDQANKKSLLDNIKYLLSQE